MGGLNRLGKALINHLAERFGGSAGIGGRVRFKRGKFNADTPGLVTLRRLGDLYSVVMIACFYFNLK